MKKSTRSGESICWDCKNARSNICPWVGKGKKVWTRARSEKRKLLKYKQKREKEEYTVYLVEECKYFIPDEKRKVCVS